mgnify:CR=1 FL=1
MTAADKQEIGVLKNYIESILPNMLDFCFNVVLAVIVEVNITLSSQTEYWSEPATDTKASV